MSTKRITHYINGASWSGSAQRSGDVFNPATGEVSAKVDFATVDVIDEAVAAAKKASIEWRNTSLAKRTQVLFAFREIVNARRKSWLKQSPLNMAKFYLMH